MSHRYSSFLVAVMLVCTNCAGGTGARNNSNWNDIDYSKVQRNPRSDVDSGYVQPSVVGCVDDDLFNCR